ncbi:AMP-binding protein, partial [Streptococcus suis]|nr:AMP-binding protein [Streptococcus suis]
KTPAKAFLRDRGSSISYADMQRRSQRAAAVLQAQGVGRGDTVALMCLNTPYILDHAQCKALVFDAALAPVVAAAPHPCARLVTEAQEAVPGVQDWGTLVA